MSKKTYYSYYYKGCFMGRNTKRAEALSWIRLEFDYPRGYRVKCNGKFYTLENIKELP